MPENAATPAGLRPFWSGALTFGLVNVPVLLFAGTRTRGGSLRMVAPDGVPLSRRYFCPAEERRVDRDDLVRGYEVEEGRYVVIPAEELDALAPEKSREIDLRRFVPEADLDPVFFERPYILVPAKGADKAYRLLARVMEDTERAGLATFVMRAKEYLVAILSRGGILRAETMRFAAEIRTPSDVGLDSPGTSKSARVRALRKAIEKAREDGLDRSELEHPRLERLEKLIEKKRRAGTDVRDIPLSARGGDDDPGGRILDLMEVLRKGLSAQTEDAAAGSDLEDKTRAALYEEAQRLDIAGRSSMTKADLIDAIRRAG